MQVTVFDQFRTKEEFLSWVDQKAVFIRLTACQKRDCIYPRELDREIGNFESIKKAWDPVSRLRETNRDVNIVISIDEYGYHLMYFIFPITREQLEAARAHRKEIAESLDSRFGGHDGLLCYPLDESVYDTIKDAVGVLFPFANRFDDNYKAYEPVGGNPLLRKSFISSIK